MSQGSRNGNYVSFTAGGAMTNGPQLSGDQTNRHDESIEQVRDLLFGVFRREIDARFAGLERRMETLEQQLKAAQDAALLERQAAFDQLSRGVGALADEIRRISRT